MKKQICLALIVVVVLSTAWTVFAQREGGGEGRRRGQDLTEEQREDLPKHINFLYSELAERIYEAEDREICVMRLHSLRLTHCNMPLRWQSGDSVLGNKMESVGLSMRSRIETLS